MTVDLAKGDHGAEVAAGDRFRFGENWARFLTRLDETRIVEAEASLKTMLGVNDLAGRRFLDIGSGSGLFSLAARRLGARVHSFDFDPRSVACTSELRRRYFEGDSAWTIEEGSVLDRVFLERLGSFDVVYAWGVLHHTGAMWQALANASLCVAPGGVLFIAIYNFQPLATRYWTFVKRTYNRAPLSRPLFLALHTLYPTLPGLVLRRLQGRRYPRGMSVWRDLVDWLGGYPFEAARPEDIFAFYRRQAFTLEALKTVGGRFGCNEFVFKRAM